MKYNHIELRGENLLRAVVEGTKANAHLVATAVLAQGLEATAEQYHTTTDKVLAALKFYLDNQSQIDRTYNEAWEDLAAKHERT